jgi:S1-C subfamily serine protease
MHSVTRFRLGALSVLCPALCCLCRPGPAGAQAVDRKLQEVEGRRIAVIAKVKPSVVAIFSPGGQGGGSGVLITKDGYALTNFHVVQGSGPMMQCGLPDGNLYDAVQVGIDRVGDVALIKLLPAKPGQEFPAATMGDSDKLRAGDWALALGNPFLLATDFTPTVTFGLISGVHRYQYPEGSRGLLEYTDCIQTDTSINPGNSGGPLFNLEGELIGINGRISLEKRGRVNSGVGYAISINQIKNFMGHLRAGLEADHATLGAIIESRSEDSQGGMVVTSILEDCDAHRRGLDLNDELVSFASRPITNANYFQNVLGLYPKGWRLPLVYRRENDKHEILVRLMGVQRGETEDNQPMPPQPVPQPRPRPLSNSPAAKLYQARPGFANYYFNKLETTRLWDAFRKQGDFNSAPGDWNIEGDWEMHGKTTSARIFIGEEKDASGKNRTIARLLLGGVNYSLDPLKQSQDPRDLQEPRGSGGLIMALYQYRRLLTLGQKGFEHLFASGGNEPFYPLPADGSKPKSYAALRVDTEVLHTEHAAAPAKWFFSLKDHALLGAEVSVINDDAPCELYFFDYKKIDSRDLPERIEVRYGNDRFGTFTIRRYQLSSAK